MEYNEIDRVTAAELRQMGIPVPDNIPDCGHTRRGSVIPKLIKNSTPKIISGYSLPIEIEFQCTKPFTWVVVNIENNE